MGNKKMKPAPAEANPDFEQKLANIAAKNGLDHHDGPEPTTESDITKKILIKSAKVEKDMFLNVKYHEQVILISSGGTKRRDISGTINREGENAIHDDLKNAFAKLNPHLALLAEMMETSALEIDDINPDAHKDFKVTGFSIGGSGESEGITLIGQKTLSTKKILNLTPPFEKWESSEYRFIHELGETIEECKHEVELYLNGKMAPPAQQAMDFPEGETEEAQQEEEA